MGLINSFQINQLPSRGEWHSASQNGFDFVPKTRGVSRGSKGEKNEGEKRGVKR